MTSFQQATHSNCCMILRLCQYYHSFCLHINRTKQDGSKLPINALIDWPTVLLTPMPRVVNILQEVTDIEFVQAFLLLVTFLTWKLGSDIFHRVAKWSYLHITRS